MGSLRILHTADVHLDAPYRFLGDRGDAQRLQVRKTFEKVCQTAVSGKYDALIIAGDLFDSNAVSERTVAWACTSLKETGIPILLCPGNHDCLDGRSVFRRAACIWPSGLHVLKGEETTCLTLPELDLTVHVRPNTTPRSADSPVKNLRRAGTTKWEIAMAHGSVLIPGKIEETDYPIKREDLEATEFDYVALGHWHSWADYSAGKVKAFYPGSPERLDFGGGVGAVAAVTLTDGGAQVEKVDLGARRMEDVELSIAGLRDDSEITRQVSSLADRELALRVTLTGLSEVGFTPNADALRDALSNAFFFLEMTDKSHPSLAEITSEMFPERLVVGKFVRQMADRIDKARGDNETVAVLEDALRVGVALLQGREAL